MTAKEVDNLMNKQSGVLGISGVSSDFRDIEDAAEKGNERAALALDVYDYRVREYDRCLCCRNGRSRCNCIYSRSWRKRYRN